MALQIIFAFSGIAIVILVGGKMWQEKRKKSFFLLRGIGKGDERVRQLSHKAVHHYSEVKEKTDFFLKKQLPMHARNVANKTTAIVKEKSEQYIGNIRGSKFLKKSDGLSEFFKNISEKENNGRIDDVLEEREETQE
jgi:hypothetical protein